MSAERFLRACRREPGDTPVWFMRQAGRYMAEYQAIRAKASILDICHDPDLATEVTLQPIRAFDLDAAIIFADILLPFEPLGLGLSFRKGEGPVVARPIRSKRDVERLPSIDPEGDLGHVLAAIRQVVRELGETPLIGFAGAPFTLASYAIEGGSSRHYIETKRMMYGDETTWRALMDKFAAVVGEYLAQQVKAGARALQLFDSWVGCLTPDDYRRYVLPYSRKAIDIASRMGAPIIHFGTGTSTFLDAMAEAGGAVIGVDWRIPLDTAWQRFPERGIQGNLDPVALFAPREELERRVVDVLRRANGRPGHIFNLGHGILPGTPPDSVKAVVEMVREWGMGHGT